MNNYKMDFTTKTLTITKAFADVAATDPESDEYSLMMKFKADFPDLKIVRKTHKSPTKYHTKAGDEYSCNQYKNLTYKNMEKFISALPNCDKVMDAYKYLRDIAGKAQTNSYKTVREWFVHQFPLYRINPIFYLYSEVIVIDPKTFHDQQQKQIAKQK